METCIENRPVPFPGTRAQKDANYWTHHWITYDEERECADCFAKSWHVAADYPCGTEPPRAISCRVPR